MGGDAMPEDAAFQAEDWNEEELIEQWANEGDEDAALVMEYEQSMLDAIQDDADLALSSTTYAEARKRLADRVKNRGFWPSSGAKGKSRGKGWEKGKRANTAMAPTLVTLEEGIDALPLEFLELPEEPIAT
ncbi:unnamed protein product, partial [Durusdinium trenchii]